MKFGHDGRYCYSYVDDAMLRETGADGEDTEDTVNTLRGQDGVEVAALFKAYRRRNSREPALQRARQRSGRSETARRRRTLPRLGPYLERLAERRHSSRSSRRWSPKACKGRRLLGFVNVFKPAGPTSAQAVARLRRIYGIYSRDRKIAAGHLGTLDPQAAGVLPVAVGKATRLIPLLEDQRKAYACTLVLGRPTTTQDALGETRRGRRRPQGLGRRA